MVSLIPFYLAGLILAGGFLVLASRRVPNRAVSACVRWIGIALTPAFLLAVLVFTGRQQQRTYQMEWMTGKPAQQYLTAGLPQRGNREFPVVLKRTSGRNHDCFEAFDSKILMAYLEARPGRVVLVGYSITYDLFRPRNVQIQRVGEFGPTSDVLRQDQRETGERSGPGSERVSCFGW